MMMILNHTIEIENFTITAQLARAHWLIFIVNKQTHFFIIYAMRQRARADNFTDCYRKKQIDVSFSCVCSVIDNEFRHGIVKGVCGSTRLLPRGERQTARKKWPRETPAWETRLARVCRPHEFIRPFSFASRTTG